MPHREILVTGKIENLSDGSTSGFIRAENGSIVPFELSAVLAYDAARLAVGQLVTFDLENGSHPLAANVCVHRPHDVADAEKRYHESARPPRYMGFEHMGHVRAYRFMRFSLGEETEIFVVNADVDLFAKHHIGIQEGPGLCLAVLVAEQNAAARGSQRRPRSLTEADMLAHVAKRPVPAAKHHPKRTPRASTSTWHTPWTR